MEVIAQIGQWGLSVLVSALTAWFTANWNSKRAAQVKRLEQIESAVEEWSLAGQSYWRQDGSLPTEESAIFLAFNKVSSRLESYYVNTRSEAANQALEDHILALHQLITGDDQSGHAFKSTRRVADSQKLTLIKSEAREIKVALSGLPVSTKSPFGFF